MNKRFPLLAGLAGLAGLLALLSHPGAVLAQEDQPVVVDIKRLSLDTALRIARTALDECRRQGVQVAVTVVDRGGDPQVVLRDVLAMPLTLDISYRKAYTAMSFNSPTSELDREGMGAIATAPNVLVSAGGLPITAGGNILGGVGISGAPSGMTDEDCARKGLESVEMDLEMEVM